MYKYCVLTAVLVLALLPTVSRGAERPNIILILVDDMGFSDIGACGGEIPTPNIDKLAENGLLFTQFYNTGRCCPTRASLLTGLYPHQAGVGHMNEDSGPEYPGYQGHLNQSCVTLGRVLSDAGYFTAVCGKWHVGASDRSMWPLQRGFDRFYGCPQGGGFYFQVKERRSIVLNNTVVASVKKPLPEGWYSTDAWTEYSLKFIDEAITQNKPFFVYLAHNAPHFPLQAAPEDIAEFRGTYKAGWDALRMQRHQRQKTKGLLDAQWPLSLRDEDIQAWDNLTEKQKDDYDLRMSIYAAVVSRLDRAVGNLVDGLKERKVLDNTLILFLSDNGACAEGGDYGRSGGQGEPGSAESNVFYGRSWAILGSTPFRLYKHYNHEGGIATPLVVHWPAGIQAKGQLCTQPGHLIDIMPTLVEVAGAKYPTKLNGNAITPMQGRSLVPAFYDKPVQRDALFWEHEGNAAVRAGDWKLVRRGFNGNWELYDLKADRTEMNNLAAEHPDKVDALKSQWMTWAKNSQVVPTPLNKP